MKRDSRTRATAGASTSYTEPGRWRGFVAKQVTGLVLGPFTGTISGLLL
jgi:putative methionine-R-sulfoxide reductase with GAF domain